MLLQLQTFITLVQNMAAAVQGASATPIDLSPGSVALALLEADASVALWLQYVTLEVLQTTRLTTSLGSDVDSWVGDFGLTRLPAVAAVGQVTFSRFTPATAASIPPRTVVLTADGSQSFAVTIDPNNPAWNGTSQTYVLAASVASASVPASAVTPSSAGNVLANTITALGQAIAGIDTVTNAAPFQGGIDAETDTALRARFVSYINSLSKATPSAVAYAIQSLQQGLSYAIGENVDPTGAPRPGFFVVTIDDGSGHPTASLLASTQTAIDAVRPVGTAFAVQPPVVTYVSVALTITVSASGSLAALIGPVGNAITSYINSLPIGSGLPLTKVVQIAYGVDPSITNVSNVTLNSATADIVVPWNGVVKAAGVVVS